MQLESPRSSWGFAFAVGTAHCYSRGSVSLRSSDPKNPPLIRMNYLQNEKDIQVLVEGIKVSRQLAYSGAFINY